VHVLGVPHIGSLLNVAKLGILTALLAILDLNLPQIAAVTAAVMILGELTQILILGSMRRSVNS
jgi:hypothetical protein